MGFSLIGNTAGNTGQILGDASKGVIKNFAIFGGKFTASDYADATSREAALKAASLKSKTDSAKLFWLPEVQNVEDRSESDKEGSLNLGYKTILVEGKPAYEVKVFGSSEFAKQMRKFNGQIVRVLEFDANQKLWGTQSGTDIIGYQAKIQTKGQKVATGQNVEEGVVTIVISFLSTGEYNDNPKMIDCSSVNMGVVKSQVDASLSEAAAHATNVYKIAVGLPTAEAGVVLNLFDYYSTQLAAASLWEAKTGTNFATNLAITTVAADATLKAFTVTLDSTAFAALGAGAKIKISGKAPSVLDAAGVEDVEIGYIVVTK